ncbi:MAG: small basic family protein [Fimbriimonadales bacterium]|nr:small basic family protein [Fimbriimonadales bacterium]MDW8052366.1 small basic family protein [Armatimonadota bacterium]
MIAVGVLGLVLGVLIATLALDISLPSEWAAYLSLAALAGLDTAFGGWRASLEGRFHTDVFISGFIVNALLAALLAYLGDRIGVDLFLAAVVTLGGRMFLNLSLIRRYYLNQLALRRQRG